MGKAFRLDGYWFGDCIGLWGDEFREDK